MDIFTYNLFDILQLPHLRIRQILVLEPLSAKQWGWNYTLCQWELMVHAGQGDMKRG